MTQTMLGRTGPERDFLFKKIKSLSPLNYLLWPALITPLLCWIYDGDITS